MLHGVFQPYCRFSRWNNCLWRFHDALIENVGVILAGLGFLHRNPLELPAVAGTAGELGPNDSGLGHADTVFRDVDGRARLKLVVASGKGILVVLFPLEPGISQCLFRCCMQ